MAWTLQDGAIPVSFWADADLSAKQYYCATAASTDKYVKAATGASNPAPVGVIQDDSADVIGESVGVLVTGFTKAVVAACDVAGNACAVKWGTYLVCGSSGYLYAAAGGNSIANARAFEALSTGCAILNVYFYGNIASCAPAAS